MKCGVVLKTTVVYFAVTSILKNKQEASGHPPNCQTEEQMRSYKNTTDISQREKLVLDPLQNEKKPCQGSHCQSLFKLLM